MKPANVLQIALSDRVNDVEVGPGHVPLALLGQFQKDVGEFLRGSGKDVDPSEVVISIEQGSLLFVATGLLAAAGLWADIELLQSNKNLGLLDPRRAVVMERWQDAARKYPYRSYRLSDQEETFSVNVDSASDFRNKQQDVWVAVEKYVHGRVLDIGGKTSPNVHLELANGTTLKINAPMQLLADEEQNHLYRPVLLHVTGEENLLTRELRNLNLQSFEKHQPTWNEQEFDALVARGTKAWSEVPDDWLEKLRGEH